MEPGKGLLDVCMCVYIHVHACVNMIEWKEYCKTLFLIQGKLRKMTSMAIKYIDMHETDI